MKESTVLRLILRLTRWVFDAERISKVIVLNKIMSFLFLSPMKKERDFTSYWKSEEFLKLEKDVF